MTDNHFLMLKVGQQPLPCPVLRVLLCLRATRHDAVWSLLENAPSSVLFYRGVQNLNNQTSHMHTHSGTSDLSATRRNIWLGEDAIKTICKRNNPEGWALIPQRVRAVDRLSPDCQAA